MPPKSLSLFASRDLIVVSLQIMSSSLKCKINIIAKTTVASTILRMSVTAGKGELINCQSDEVSEGDMKQVCNMAQDRSRLE